MNKPSSDVVVLDIARMADSLDRTVFVSRTGRWMIPIPYHLLPIRLKIWFWKAAKSSRTSSSNVEVHNGKKNKVQTLVIIHQCNLGSELGKRVGGAVPPIPYLVAMLAWGSFPSFALDKGLNLHTQPQSLYLQYYICEQISLNIVQIPVCNTSTLHSWNLTRPAEISLPVLDGCQFFQYIFVTITQKNI